MAGWTEAKQVIQFKRLEVVWETENKTEPAIPPRLACHLPPPSTDPPLAPPLVPSLTESTLTRSYTSPKI